MNAICLVSGLFSGVGVVSSLASGTHWLAVLNLAFFVLNLFLSWPSPSSLKEQIK